MNKSSTASTPPLAGTSTLLTPALLTIDRHGIILAANGPALRLWQATPGQLLNTPFARLFAFDGTTVATAGTDAQWHLLLANSLNRTVACPVRLPHGTAEVGLRLEEAQGTATGYYAILEDPALHRDSSPPMIVDSGLALLADQGAVAFFDLNLKARQLYFSPAWKRLLGYADRELPADHAAWLRLIHPEDSAAAQASPQRKTAPGTHPFAAEIRMLHRQGHYLWVQTLGTRTVSPSGDTERITGLLLDIAERKDAEDHSHLNDERLHLLTAGAGLAALDFDFARGRFWLSPEWSMFLGSPSDHAASVLDIFLAALPPADAARGAETFFLSPFPGQGTYQQTLVLRTADGRPVPVLLAVHRQLTRKGALARVTAAALPLPSELRAAATLPIPAPLVADTLNDAAEGILLSDTQGRVTFLNTAAERLLRRPLAHARGTPLADLFRLVDPDTSVPDADALELAFASPRRARPCPDHALLPADGSTPRRIVWTARQVWAPAGTLEGIIVIFRDPQEMTLTPEELLKMNRWESLGVVAGGIAHDFNNLLTTILGGISQAKDNRDSSYLANSERACLAAKALTKQLLAAAKGGGPEIAQVLSPGELLSDAIRIGRAGSNAEVILDAPDNVAPFRVNRAQMLQVFQNLIINALQALPPDGGKIWITAANLRLEHGAIPPLPPGSYADIRVKDNGSGIAPEHLEKIFEPLFTTKKQGTGLGLSTVRNIVLRHGGHIRVSSTPGVGTVFRILLPQTDREIETAERRPPVLVSGDGNSRILLMDDDPDIAHLASGMLASLDYKYEIARNGEEALVLYRRYLNIGRPIDLVFLDLTVVGGMGGEETFRKLRELDPKVRAIVCSGYDSDEMERHYRAMGFVGYLSKPFRLGDLARAIKAVLG